jgi:DnaJ-class molecular chaperone
MAVETMKMCPECQGSGQIQSALCGTCRGRGVVPEGSSDAGAEKQRERHHGVGSDGLHPGDETKPTHVEDHAGLGAGGEKP